MTNGETLFQALGDVREDLVAESAAPPAARRRTWLRWSVAAAACVCLLAGLGSLAAEAQAYQEAVAFFEENGLTPEGLSRSEIKAVYRDITTERFTYEKTAYVVANSAGGAVDGFELYQNLGEPGSAADLQAVFERIRARKQSGVHYEICYFSEPVGDPAEGLTRERSEFAKYDGETCLWSVPLGFDYAADWTAVTDGFLLWGHNLTSSSSERTYARLCKIGPEGELLWKQTMFHGFDDEYIAAVLENDDGSYAVISRGDLHYLVLSQYDAAGRELSCCRSEVGNLGIWNAARLGEDYIVLLGNNSLGQEQIVKLARDGTLSDAFSYGAADCDYHIQSMAEFGGKLYLSGYATPKAPEAEYHSRRDEIRTVLDVIFERGGWEIESAELVKLLRDSYTAVLLVCDPGAGTPETFYTVPGCMGAGLTADGRLQWDVERFTDAYFSPATSAFSIASSCQVTRYTFDADGMLQGRAQTGEETAYYR